MSKVFEEYQDALQRYATRVVEVSQQINSNRAAFTVAAQKFEQAVLEDKDTGEAESEMAGLNAEFELLTRKANALNAVSKKGANSTIRSAAQAVFKVNQEAIKGMQTDYDARKQALLDMQTAYLKALIEIGQLARASSTLREECTLAQADAQLSIAVAALGDELGGLISRRRGWIFPDQDAIALAFTSGELPADQTFAGTVTGTPRPKVLTADAEPAPPRQFRRPEKSVKPEQAAKADAQ